MTDRHQASSYPLRLPADLKERIAESARRNGRSFNAEVSARLQASFDVEDFEVPAFLRVAQVPVTVLQLTVAPGTTVAEVHRALAAAMRDVPADTKVVLTPTR